MNSLKGPLIALVLVVLAYYAWVGLTRRSDDQPDTRADANTPADDPQETPAPGSPGLDDIAPASPVMPPSYPPMELSPPVANSPGAEVPRPYMPGAGDGVGNVEITDLGPSGGGMGPYSGIGMSTAVDAASMAADFETTLADVKAMISRGEFETALRFLSNYHDNPDLSPAQSEEVLRLLNGLAYSVIYSPERHLLQPPHEVTYDGTTIRDVAAEYAVPAELLGSINNIGLDQPLFPGQRLKVIRGPFDAVVDLSDGIITLTLGGAFAGQFPLRRLPDFQVPEGDFLVEISTSRTVRSPRDTGSGCKRPTPTGTKPNRRSGFMATSTTRREAPRKPGHR